MKITDFRPNMSISGRLMVRVLIVSAVIFTFAFSLFLRMSAGKMREEAADHAHSELSNTIHQIDAILKAVEIAVENTAWVVPNNLASTDSLYAVTERLLKNNEFIFGSAIAFEPNYYSSEGYHFSPYSFRGKNGNIRSRQLGTETYDYHTMDWYQIPKLLNKPYWSEPYYDDGGGDMMMTTYSRPLYDNNGKMYAVITADLSLTSLTDLVGSIKAFDDSYNIMLSRNASYLVHPNRELILNETLYSATYGQTDAPLRKMQADILEGKEGEILRQIQGDDYFVFYSPVETTQWTVAVVCPKSGLYKDVKTLRRMLIVLGIIALLLLIALSYNGIRKVVAPIEEFSGVAKKIAAGKFD
ncbi:MAG: hypothetical protein IKU18_02285, partial [Bacteroidales bacterium]|nr:hypothetical protein [Bacteroidales bacterium]